MRKILLHILALVALLSSCSTIQHEPASDENQMGIVQGTITDMSNNLLEHIKITITPNGSNDSRTLYTSSEGKFSCEIPVEMKSGQLSLNILIEDIDGENNGGYFESKADVITIFEEQGMKYPIIIALPTYRLNPSTASENSRRF